MLSIEHRRLQHMSSNDAFKHTWLLPLPSLSWTGCASLVLLPWRCCGGRAPASGWSADVRGPLPSMPYAVYRCTHMLRWLC